VKCLYKPSSTVRVILVGCGEDISYAYRIVVGESFKIEILKTGNGIKG
jgi:hypothetical protein